MTQSRVARPRGRSQSRRGPRRKVEWVDTEIDFTTASGGVETQALDVGIPTDERKGMTLLRTLIDITMIAITAGTGSVVGAGIYMISREALTALALFEPDQADDDAGWVWRVIRASVFTSVQNDT